MDTGGTDNTTLALGIWVLNGVDVVDNTVSGVAPLASDSEPSSLFGIIASNNSGTIRGNRIRGLQVDGDGNAAGIAIYNSENDGRAGRGVVRDNSISTTQRQGLTHGIRCAGFAARAKDNTIDGFGTALAGCGDGGGNDVH